MFTERQQQLIDKCKSVGYGWGKFAESVEAQGFCSHNQEETLVKMWQKIQHTEAVKAGNITPDYNHCYDSDISDNEAYRSKDYF